jgi:hypothetical protein
MPQIGGGISASRLVGTMLGEDGSPILSTLSESDDQEEVGFGTGLRRWIQSGFLNGDFSMGPADGTGAPGTQIVPYWTYRQLSGTAIKVAALDDSTSASGRVLRFVCGAGAANDYTVIEQIIQVNGSRNRAWSYRPVAAITASASFPDTAFEWVTAIQYLKRDGSTTGSELANALGSGDGIFLTTVAEVGPGVDFSIPWSSILSVPADAAYARVRIGVRRDGSTSATGYVDISEAYLAIGVPRIDLVDVQQPSIYGPGEITQQGGHLILRPDTDDLAGGDIWLPKRVFFSARGGGEQTLVAGSTILAAESYKEISSVGNITLTATPTIDGSVTTIGALLMITNVGTFTITFQDRGTLAGSDLFLSTATFVMGPNDNLTLIRTSGAAAWVEFGRTNVL